jgi:flagellar motor switch protein FliM
MRGAEQERDSTAWLREGRADNAALAIEKAPQFTASLARFAESVGAALEDICGRGAGAALERVAGTTTFDLFGASQGYLAATLRSETLDSRAVMIFDPSAAEVLLNAIFGEELGADAAAKGPAPPKRANTNFEVRVVEGIADVLAQTLCAAFAPSAAFDLAIEAVSAIADVKLLGARDLPAITMHFAISTRAGVFLLIVALPQNAAKPLGEMFARGPDPTAPTADPHWTRQMEKGVAKARLTLTAILDEFQMTLRDVSMLKVGMMLPLSNSGEGHVRIECVERGVFLCRLNESNERYALEIEDIISTHPDDES